MSMCADGHEGRVAKTPVFGESDAENPNTETGTRVRSPFVSPRSNLISEHEREAGPGSGRATVWPAIAFRPAPTQAGSRSRFGVDPRRKRRVRAAPCKRTVTSARCARARMSHEAADGAGTWRGRRRFTLPPTTSGMPSSAFAVLRGGRRCHRECGLPGPGRRRPSRRGSCGPR